MIVPLTCKIDATNLNFGIALARVYSKRTPAAAANTAGYFIARQARVDTPAVTMGRIDTELGVLSTPMLATRGKRKGLALKSGRKNISVDSAITAGAGQFSSVPLSWLLISARAKSGSKYNKQTANRFALSVHPLKGKRLSQFATVMAAAVQRMISARHSSTNFFASAWIPVIQTLEQFVAAKYRRFGAAAPSSAEKRRVPADHGRAIAAREGSLTAFCTIENLIGMSGRFGQLDARRNAALHAVAGPALQSAINKEFDKTMKYVAEQEWLANATQFRSYGFLLA